MNLPIIFIHKGYSEYLEFSLRQAKHSNPSSEIILLGDESNNRFDFITHININEYFEQAAEFENVYEHLSTNSYEYEIFCFQRWMILEEYVTARNFKEIFVCDSDIMLYSNITKLMHNEHKDYDIGVAYNSSQQHVSIGLSYWKTQYLHLYNQCTFKLYQNDNVGLLKEKWHELVSLHGVGAISDMTSAISFFKEFCTKLRFFSFEEVINEAIFENNINESSSFFPNEYRMKYGHKQLRWIDKIPYGYNLKQEKIIKFHGLHCQGPAKFMVSKLYTGKSFNGSCKLALKFKLLSWIAFWYKILRIRYRFAFLFELVHKHNKRK